MNYAWWNSRKYKMSILFGSTNLSSKHPIETTKAETLHVISDCSTFIVIADAFTPIWVRQRWNKSNKTRTPDYKKYCTCLSNFDSNLIQGNCFIIMGKIAFYKFLPIHLPFSFWDLINTRLKVKVYGNGKKVLFLFIGILWYLN